MEYFKKIQCYKPTTGVIDSPVRIEEIALLQDSVDKNILGRVKFINQSQKNIIAIFVNMVAQNIAGESIALESKRYIYQDMLISSGELYGNKIPIALPDDTRKFQVSLDKVVFEDGSIWNVDPANVCEVIPQEEISVPKECLQKYKEKLSEKINNLEYVKYYYEEGINFWECSCGKIHNFDEVSCDFCSLNRHMQKSILTKDAIYQSVLEITVQLENEKAEQAKIRQKEQEEREKQQRQRDIEYEKKKREWEIEAQEKYENQEKQRQELAGKRKKRHIVIGIVVGIISVVVIGKWVNDNIIVKNDEYNRAVELMNAEKYQEAINAFEELDGYKDSLTQIDNANEMLQEQMYQNAIDLMNNEKYEEAIEVWNEIIDYKDSWTQCEEAERNYIEITQKSLYEKGMEYLENNDYENAKKMFEDCLSYGSYNDVKNQIAKIKILQTKIQSTVDEIEKASQFLGMHSETSTILLDQDEYSFITKKVNILGYFGTFTHGYETGLEDVYINEMTWESSKTIFNDKKIYNNFIKGLLCIYGEEKEVRTYNNFDVYIWSDVEKYKTISCWINEENKVCICWTIE